MWKVPKLHSFNGIKILVVHEGRKKEYEYFIFHLRAVLHLLLSYFAQSGMRSKPPALLL